MQQKNFRPIERQVGDVQGLGKDQRHYFHTYFQSFGTDESIFSEGLFQTAS